MKDDVRVHMETYLDSVEAALLRAGVSRGQRLGIVRDLEAQIQEMAAERSAGREVEIDDMRAVLAALDNPATYAQGAVRGPANAEPPTRRRLPWEARWGMALLPASWIGIGILMGIGTASRHSDHSDLLLLMLTATPVVLMVFLTSFLGWNAWRRVGRERHRYWGKPIALVEMISFPLLVFIASPLLVFSAALALGSFFVVRRVWQLMAAGHDMNFGKAANW